MALEEGGEETLAQEWRKVKGEIRRSRGRTCDSSRNSQMQKKGGVPTRFLFEKVKNSALENVQTSSSQMNRGHM